MGAMGYHGNFMEYIRPSLKSEGFTRLPIEPFVEIVSTYCSRMQPVSILSGREAINLP